MTCIIGFVDHRGDVLLVADSRVSWRIASPGDRRHADEVQKVVIPAPCMAVAAAGSLADAQMILTGVLGRMRCCPEAGKWNARTAWRYSEGVRRSLGYAAPRIDSSVDLLVAVAFPSHSAMGRLYHASYRHGSATVVEVRKSDHRVCGSVRNEKQFTDFEQQVVRSAVGNASYPMVMRVSLLATEYRKFRALQPGHWKTVGQLLHTVHSDNGVWQFASTGTTSIVAGGKTVRVAIVFRRKGQSYWQVGNAGQRRVQLRSWLSYGDQGAPTQSRTFDAPLALGESARAR